MAGHAHRPWQRPRHRVHYKKAEVRGGHLDAVSISPAAATAATASAGATAVAANAAELPSGSPGRLTTSAVDPLLPHNRERCQQTDHSNDEHDNLRCAHAAECTPVLPVSSLNGRRQMELDPFGPAVTIAANDQSVCTGSSRYGPDVRSKPPLAFSPRRRTTLDVAQSAACFYRNTAPGGAVRP